jgi:hypothetical protein
MKFHYLYASNTTGIFTSYSFRWLGHVALWERCEIDTELLPENTKGKEQY